MAMRPSSRDDAAKGEAYFLVAVATRGCNDDLALRFRARVISFSLLRAALEMPLSSLRFCFVDFLNKHSWIKKRVCNSTGHDVVDLERLVARHRTSAVGMSISGVGKVRLDGFDIDNSQTRLLFFLARFKVDNQLDNWRVGNTFDVKGFENGLLLGRLL